MRIALAQVWQETNTFSPVITGLGTFEQNGLYTGAEILEKMHAIGELGGFLAEAEAHGGVEPVPLLRALAVSSGRVSAEALQFFRQRLAAGLQAAGPLDGVFLSLHGASAAEGVDDLEGCLLEEVRQVIGRDIPLVASFDHHANLTQAIVNAVDALVGYATQPHDPYETGQRAARLLFSIVERAVRPALAWVKIPMIAPADRFQTAEHPMKTWFDLARSLEKRAGVLSISTFPVQPWLDVAELGWAAVAITDGDEAAARHLALRLANQAWALRAEFWKVNRLPAAEAVRRAGRAPAGPIILSDASDSVLSGATGDSTCILRALLDEPPEGLALLPIVDPEVVVGALQAGVGSEITVQIGGKLDRVFGQPVRISGRVLGTAEDGLRSTFLGWGTADLGRAVLLEAGPVKLLVSERSGSGGTDPDAYRYFGIEPAAAQIIVVKTYHNYQRYAAFLKGVLTVDCPGLSGWDLRTYPWANIPRPIYPFDDLRSPRRPRSASRV